MFERMHDALSPDVRGFLEASLEGRELDLVAAERLLQVTGMDFHGESP